MIPSCQVGLPVSENEVYGEMESRQSWTWRNSSQGDELDGNGVEY